MARAETPTWLPLDTWFAIIGVNPLHSNGLVSNTLFPATVCGTPWQQFAWQSADKVSREDLAITIRDAERAIAGEVGYNLLPDWQVAERKQTPRPAGPELYATRALNLRGQRMSVATTMNHIISGGVKVTALIEAGVAVVRSDPDGDTYAELVTVTVNTTVTNLNEIRVFYPGENGDEEWEIRPIEVSLAAGVATITFNSWQIVDPDEQLQVTTLGDNQGIDADAAGSYLTTVDVYRVFNDPQTQAQLLTEPAPAVGSLSFCGCGSSTCPTCSFNAQDACLMVRNPRNGIFSYAPATWDPVTETFTVDSLVDCRNADQIRMWYYSGWRNESLARPNVVMDRFWQYAVAYYAAALLDRPTCGCSNVTEILQYYRNDKSRSGGDLSFAISPHQVDNAFGTTEGALYALKRVNEPGRKIGR